MKRATTTRSAKSGEHACGRRNVQRRRTAAGSVSAVCAQLASSSYRLAMGGVLSLLPSSCVPLPTSSSSSSASVGTPLQMREHRHGYIRSTQQAEFPSPNMVKPSRRSSRRMKPIVELATHKRAETRSPASPLRFAQPRTASRRTAPHRFAPPASPRPRYSTTQGASAATRRWREQRGGACCGERRGPARANLGPAGR